MCMGGGNIFACIDDASAEEHGDEHTLACEQVRHIGTLKEAADTVIGQDSSVEGICGRPDCLSSANQVIQFVDHGDTPDRWEWSYPGDLISWSPSVPARPLTIASFRTPMQLHRASVESSLIPGGLRVCLPD